MKCIAFLLLIANLAFAETYNRGIAHSCAYTVLTVNLRGDETKVSQYCTECITSMPISGVERTDELIAKLSVDCIHEYFNLRNETKFIR